MGHLINEALMSPATMCLTAAERNNSVQKTDRIYQSMSALSLLVAEDANQTGAHLGSCDSTRVLSKFCSGEPNHNTFKRQIFHKVTAQNKSNTFLLMEATQFR